MTNAKAFGSTLARIRKEKGFPSAYQFFKSIGGSKSLGFAFVSYWDMERGKKLPKSWRLEAIMAALGVEQNSPEAKELVRAYFKSLSGSDKLVQILAEPSVDSSDLPSRELAEAATRKAMEHISVNITLDQWKLCARDLTTNICDYYLVNTAGWVTFAELSAATGFKPGAVLKAVKALAAGGLAEISGNKVQSGFAKKMVEVLPSTPATDGINAALRGHMNKWLETCKLIDAKRVTMRMTKANLNIYRQHLEKALNLAGIYFNSDEDKKDSAIYLVDTSVFQLFS